MRSTGLNIHLARARLIREELKRVLHRINLGSAQERQDTQDTTSHKPGDAATCARPNVSFDQLREKMKMSSETFTLFWAIKSCDRDDWQRWHHCIFCNVNLHIKCVLIYFNQSNGKAKKVFVAAALPAPKHTVALWLCSEQISGLGTRWILVVLCLQARFI